MPVNSHSSNSSLRGGWEGLCIYIMLLLVFVSCRDKHEQLISKEDVTVDVMLPMTPVKNQGSTTLCWLYAMLATIETDRLCMGDSVNLSPMWLARKSLEEQTTQAYLVRCFVSLRGTLMEAMRLYNKYGIVGWDAAMPQASQGTDTEKKIQHLAWTMSAQMRGTKALKDAVEDILNEDIGPMPRYVFMLGAEYTPEEFARSCAMPDDWKAYTSFTHHPYGSPFCIEVLDNRQRNEAMNIPLDSLYDKVVNSIRHRHPVAWEGCLKTPPHPSPKGRANDYTKQRQRAFESFRLTDDHCMAIVGLGHLKDGTPVFICKNSWGDNDANRGLTYMTKQQFLMSTVVVMVKSKM